MVQACIISFTSNIVSPNRHSFYLLALGTLKMFVQLLCLAVKLIFFVIVGPVTFSNKSIMFLYEINLTNKARVQTHPVVVCNEC